MQMESEYMKMEGSSSKLLRFRILEQKRSPLYIHRFFPE